MNYTTESNYNGSFPSFRTSSGGSTERVGSLWITICDIQNVYQDLQGKESGVLVSRYHCVVVEFYLPQMLGSFNKWM
jgi:hypothetical protein